MRYDKCPMCPGKKRDTSEFCRDCRTAMQQTEAYILQDLAWVMADMEQAAQVRVCAVARSCVAPIGRVG